MFLNTICNAFEHHCIKVGIKSSKTCLTQTHYHTPNLKHTKIIKGVCSHVYEKGGANVENFENEWSRP